VESPRTPCFESVRWDRRIRPVSNAARVKRDRDRGDPVSRVRSGLVFHRHRGSASRPHCGAFTRTIRPAAFRFRSFPLPSRSTRPNRPAMLPIVIDKAVKPRRSLLPGVGIQSPRDYEKKRARRVPRPDAAEGLGRDPEAGAKMNTPSEIGNIRDREREALALVAQGPVSTTEILRSSS
jgi:hypothetical protein